MSKSFRDAQGREWHPRITVATLADYEDLTGIALLTAGRDIHAGKMGNLVRLAFLACRLEVADRKCDFKDFAEALTTQAHVEALSQAVQAAFADFSPNPSLVKAAAGNPGPGAPSTN